MAWISTDRITRLGSVLDPSPFKWGGVGVIRRRRGHERGCFRPLRRGLPATPPHLNGEGWDLRRRREIQLYADAVGIVEEDLLAAGARDHLLAEFHLLGLELAA